MDILKGKRYDIMNVLWEEGRPLSAFEINDIAPELKMPTVRRCLELLLKENLIQVAGTSMNGKVYSVKRNVDESLCFAAIVPDYKLLTEAARAALPKEVSHKDAVYNLSRAALVPAAFCEGRHDLLAIAPCAKSEAKRS